MRIEGKAALVTGAASGLGLAAARKLARAGASVVLADLEDSNGEVAAKEIGDRARFIATDVTDEERARAAVDLAAAEFGGLHICVNCAGVGTAGRLLDRAGKPLDLGIFEFTVRVNLTGTFNVMRWAAAQMAKQEPEGEERGVIVNTASIAAFDGMIGQVAYSASKGGVVGMTLPAARDLASKKIRCVAIAPGSFDTPMLSLLPQEGRDAITERTPHPHRLGKPDEFGALVAHVIENPFINGEVIRIDGALRMPPR